MKATVLIAVVLGVLVLVSAVQAFQLNALREKVKDAKLNTGGGASSFSAGAAPSSGPAVPANLQNLPSMVGGC